jgi:hypothetical protein
MDISMSFIIPSVEHIRLVYKVPFYNHVSLLPVLGRAVAQAVSCWLATVAAQVCVRAGMWGLWWTKQHWGRFSPSTLVFPANHHSTNFSIIIITRGWHHRPIGGRIFTCFNV